MALGLLKEIPPFEGRTPDWLDAPPYKMWPKEVAAIASVVPAILACLFFYNMPAGVNPLTVSAYVLVPAVLLTMPLHEVIHALATPNFGLTRKTRFGFNPNYGLFCIYLGGLSIPRFRIMALMPFLILTVFPMVLETMGLGNDFLRVMAAINAGVSTMDLVSTFTIGKVYPKGSLMAADGNKGIYLPPRS